MAAGAHDIAICGTTPFAGLLAGLLATAHGKRVCLVGSPWSPYRLTHGFNVSVMPSARPETWTMLQRGGGETLKLLGTIGKGVYERVDPLFVAETAASAELLGHMRWLALGFGFAAEKAVDSNITPAGAICRIRDAAMLVGGRVEPAIDQWLEKTNVHRLSARETSIALRKDGSYTLRPADAQVDVATVILADDEAILTRLPAAERHRLLTVAPRISLTSEPTQKPMAAALIDWLDRGTVVLQRAGKGPIAAIAAGEADAALPKIGASLPGLGAVGRAAQARFLSVGTSDGAPLIGRMGKAKLTAIAGLGPSAAFLAPLVARYIAGGASEDEARYFEARDVGKASSRAAVAETAAPEMVA